MIFDHRDYKSFLRSALTERLGTNSRYSLRAFSRDLDLPVSTLSDILNNKKHLSQEKTLIVAEKLKLNLKEKQYFFALVDHARAKSVKLKAHIGEKLQTIHPNKMYLNLEVDQFKMISDWYHPVLLEMIDLFEDQFTPSKAAKKLEISIHEVNLALDRMNRLGLVKKTNSGLFKKTNQNVRVSSAISCLALQEFHSKMLDRAKQSIRQQSPTEKFIGSETLCFDEANLENFNEITEVYFQQISKLAKKTKMSQKASHVYHLGIQFFKLHK